MEDARVKKSYEDLTVTLLLIFPVVIASVKIIGNLILLILVFIGIYILLNEKKSPLKIPELRLLSWLTLSYFLVMLFSIIQNDGFVYELNHLGRKAHFALAPFIALAIYRVNLNLSRVLLNVKFGLFIIGLIVIYQNFAGSGRAAGMYNANIFGDLVLTMTIFSIVNFFEEDRFNKLITIISSSLGVYAVILSGNRGTFLMLMILLAVYLIIIFNKYFKGKTKSKIILLLTCSFLLYGLTLNDQVSKGLRTAKNNIILWSNDVSVANISSAGMRLEMWSGSIEAFKISPWTGHGYRNANNVVSDYVNPEIKETISAFTHLHNEYITNLVSAGVIGLISLLALLLLPLRVFLQNFRNGIKSECSIMGILLCLSYAGIGMTHIAFGEEHVNAFYIYFISILLPMAIKERNYHL